MMMPSFDDNYAHFASDVCTPINRARSSYVGCVDNDTTTTQAPSTPPAAAPTSTPDDNQEPKTPTPTTSDTPADYNVLSETQERMVNYLTPSSRGIKSNLRVMTRDAMIGMRKFKVRGHGQYYDGD